MFARLQEEPDQCKNSEIQLPHQPQAEDRIDSQAACLQREGDQRMS